MLDRVFLSNARHPRVSVLGQICGNKDTSRAVADDASQQSGISPDLLKKMLPIIAMLVAGYLAKCAGAGQQPGDRAGEQPSAGGGHGDLLGGLLGGGASGKAGNNPLSSILEGLTRR